MQFFFLALLLRRIDISRYRQLSPHYRRDAWISTVEKHSKRSFKQPYTLVFGNVLVSQVLMWYVILKYTPYFNHTILTLHKWLVWMDAFILPPVPLTKVQLPSAAFLHDSGRILYQTWNISVLVMQYLSVIQKENVSFSSYMKKISQLNIEQV